MLLNKVTQSLASLFSQATLASKGRYHIWSLISNEGDALMEIRHRGGQKDPTFSCTGMYDETTSKYFSMCCDNLCMTRRFRNGVMKFLRVSSGKQKWSIDAMTMGPAGERLLHD